MPKYVTTKGSLQCGCGVTISLSGVCAASFEVEGAPIAACEGVVGTPITGCPQAPPAKPCTAIASLLTGRSTTKEVGQKTPLLDNASGLTDGAPPQRWTVSDPGQGSMDEG